jgi:hypothetical protein
LLRLINHLPPSLFLSSSHIGWTPSCNSKAKSLHVQPHICFIPTVCSWDRANNQTHKDFAKCQKFQTTYYWAKNSHQGSKLAHAHKSETSKILLYMSYLK